MSWQSSGASVKGSAHLGLGMPNQDSWLKRHYAWGEFIGVSDGLGSKPSSEVGSRQACRAAVGAVRFHVKSPRSSIDALCSMIHALWKIMINHTRADLFSSTCLFAFRRGNEMILSQLGDGLAGVCMRDGEIILIKDEEDDSFVNMTACLGENHRPNLWRSRRLQADECQAVFLMSDGISGGIKEGKESRFLEMLHSHLSGFPPIQRSREIRRWLRAWSYPNDSDDKTIACLMRRYD